MSTSTETLPPTRPFWFRRWPSVLGIVATSILLAFGELRHDVAAITIAVCALIYVGWSQFTRQTRVRQWLGLVLFGAITVLALFLDHRFAMYVIAAGLFGHAAWDVVHYHRREAVSRWWAELCVVVDVILGGWIVATTLL